MSLPELSDRDIDGYYADCPRWGGCFSKDETRRVRNGRFYILNMDEPGGAGSHWVLLSLMDPKVGVYFDSFGVPAPRSVVNCLRRHRGTSLRNLTQVQGISASSCGWWCVFVANELMRGRPFHEIVNDFRDDRGQNESKLRKYFRRCPEYIAR